MSGAGHRLLTDALRRELPPFYATEHDADPLIWAKFFTPWAGWTWYVTEYDGEDLCFGLVDGFEAEMGYFSLSELESIRGPRGLVIERDHYFTPTPLSKIRRRIETRRAREEDPRLPFKGRGR